MVRSILFFVAFLSSTLVFALTTQQRVKQLKPTVVNLRVSSPHFFEIRSAGSFVGTGFIADRRKGLVVTNKHLVSSNPSQIRVTFFDGSSTLARLVYEDATHDFSIVQYDPKKVKAPVKQVRIGDYFRIKEGAPLLLIGNNDGEEYSIKEGVAVDLAKNKGGRHSLTLHTSFDRTNGSSGSPVWNARNEVIGLHFKGSNTSSFELPINYIQDQLKRIRGNKPTQRGEIGVQLDHIKLADAEKFFQFPKKLSQKIRYQKKGLTHLTYVKSLIKGLPAEEALQVGDIIYQVKKKTIADNLYLFDHLVDQSINQAIPIQVVRRGTLLNVNISVENAKKYKVSEFALLGGGTFHPITPLVQLYYDTPQEGVYFSQAVKGSSFDRVGVTSKKVPMRKGVIVSALNGIPVKNFNDFLGAAKTLKDQQRITVTYKDAYYNMPLQVKWLILDLKTSSFQHFQWSDEKREWVQL